MSGFIGDGSANETLDGWLGTTALGPSTVYLALFTAAPSSAGGGTEVSATGYARVAVTNNSTNFPAASGKTKVNGAVFDFGVAAADQGTIVWAAWVKTSSGTLGPDDIILAGPMNTPRLVLAGDDFKIPAGAFSATCA